MTVRELNRRCTATCMPALSRDWRRRRLSTINILTSTEFRSNSPGPITDSITLSPEKMLEMTADRDMLFHFTTTGPARDGQLRFRWYGCHLDDPCTHAHIKNIHRMITGGRMKLAFSPSAFFSARSGSDIFTEEDLPRPEQGPTSEDTDPSLEPHNITVAFALPAGIAGYVPSSC